MRPTWAEISLKNLRQNFRNIQQHVGREVAVCVVLKGDASGHGAIHCAQALQDEGARWFAVGSTGEGVCLRDAGITDRILLLAGYWQGEEEEVLGQRLTPAVWEPWHVSRLAVAIDRCGEAPFPVHLKVDTGLARLGVESGCLPEMLRALRSTPGLKLEGLFTHLASAEVLDTSDTSEQMARFKIARQTVLEAGFSPVYFHMANSAAIATRPATWDNMVRAGISLFGYFPRFVSGGAHCAIPCPSVTPVLSWKTRIISLRDLRANQRVGYNGTYVTTAATRVAVLPVGFADGLSRQLSSRGRAIVRDAFAPIVGIIAMELTLLDVSGIEGVCVGDEAILIGSTEHCCITAWEHAEIENTVPDEVLCGIAARVPRHYVDYSG
jgi:alanine racemase